MSQYYTQGASKPRWQQEFERAFQAYAVGDFESAVDICRQLEWTEEANPAVMHLLGASLSFLGEFEEARTELGRSLEINPRNPQALCDLGYTHRMQGEFDRAHEHVDRALAMMPNYHAALRAKAEMFHMAGKTDEAHAVLSPVIEEGVDHPNVVLAFGELCADTDRGEDAVGLLETLRANEQMSPQYRASASMMLGKIHEAAGDYEEAWLSYDRGNQLTPVPGEPSTIEAWVDQQVEFFTPQRMGELARAQDRSERSVFIVGFPRSGTTLLEQILSSHPDLFGAGERSLIPRISRANAADDWTQESVDAASEEYQSEIGNFAPESAKRTTDKNPGNYMHLGFINAILPGARIIHCTRDPVDTCLSCFTQDFAHRHAYSRELEWLGRAYKAYQKMAAHFESVIDLPMQTVRYEELISDRERVTRELLEFVGLPWNDACLKPHESSRPTITASHAQVRKPVYDTSVGRAERFASHLGPLKRTLGVE